MSEANIHVIAGMFALLYTIGVIIGKLLRLYFPEER